MDKNYQYSIKLINKKHDLINIRLIDKSEIKLPQLGFIKLYC